MEVVDGPASSDSDLSDSWNIVDHDEATSAAPSIESSDGESIEILDDDALELVPSCVAEEQSSGMKPAGAEKSLDGTDGATTDVHYPAEPLPHSGVNGCSFNYHIACSCIILLTLIALNFLKAIHNKSDPLQRVFGIWDDDQPDFPIVEGQEMINLKTCEMEHKQLTDVFDAFHEALSDLEHHRISVLTFLDISKKLFADSQKKQWGNVAVKEVNTCLEEKCDYFAIEKNIDSGEKSKIRQSETTVNENRSGYGVHNNKNSSNDAANDKSEYEVNNSLRGDEDWVTIEDYSDDNIMHSKKNKKRWEVQEGLQELIDILGRFSVDKEFIDEFDNVKNIIYVLSSKIRVGSHEVDQLVSDIRSSIEKMLFSLYRMKNKLIRSLRE